MDLSGSLLAWIYAGFDLDITILIYKKGDEGTPSHWTPNSARSAIYKINAATWAKRLPE